MEIGAVFLTLAVAFAVGLFVAQPFQARASRGKKAESQEVSALMAERERMINALQELDFDHVLGKIPAEDYPAQRAELVQRGAEILRKLDELSPSPVIGRGMSAGRGEGDIESAIAARRAKKNLASPDDDNLEAMIASRRSTRKNKSGGFCPRCGKPVLATDRFCPNCGKSIT